MSNTNDSSKIESNFESGGKKKETGLSLSNKKDENFGDWYTEDLFDDKIKKMKIKNCYFSLLVTKAVLKKEKDHFYGFAPEVAYVTKSGKSELDADIAIRHISETVMYPYFFKWVRGHRDLPLKLNQWCSVIRWEFSCPTPFIRSREFLWREGHSAFATQVEADTEKTDEERPEGLGRWNKMRYRLRGGREAEISGCCGCNRQVYEDYLAVPVVKCKKSELEKFPGGYYTPSVEAFIPNAGRGVQAETSDCLGHNFAKTFDATFENEKGETSMVWENSWAYSTRTVNAVRRDNYANIDLPMADLVDRVAELLDQIQQNLFDVAKQKRDACIQVIKIWDEFVDALAHKKLILAPWCDEEEVEKDVKARMKEGDNGGAAITLCTPFEQPKLEEGTLCFSGKPAKRWTYWSRSYLNHIRSMH